MSPDHNKIIDFCRTYGYSFFPVMAGDKRPLIKWTDFQNKIASDKEIENWLQRYPRMNIGIVTGMISNLVVVDLDLQKGEVDRSQFELPITFSVRTGGGGEHHYYTYPAGQNIKNNVGIFPHVDIRGDGGFVVSPWSIHQSGGMYEILNDNGGVLAECPSWVYEIQSKKLIHSESAEHVHKEGTRNNLTTQWLGSKLHGCEKKDIPKIWEQLLVMNKIMNSPGLPEEELRKIFDSIVSREFKTQEEKEGTQIHKCMEILTNNGKFILDQVGDACYVLRIDSSQRVMPIDGTAFRDWIQGQFHKKYKSALSGNMISNISSLARCKADECNDRQQVEIRILNNENGILYDLNDSGLRCISIDDNGWRLTDNNVGYFRRTKNAREQVVPNMQGDIELLWKYVNISDQNMKILVMCTIVAMFIPNIQHPLLRVHGQKGSAKSTFLSVLKRLVDPSSKNLLNLPGESNKLIHTFLNDYLLVYDNVSRISPETSDDLCRAVSGGSLSKRKLHTDSDDIIYAFQKCICINGINLEANQPDLLQRSIVVELDPIGPERRISELKFWKNFEIDLPYILGGVFDTLSCAMSIEKTVQEGDIPLQRLADFSKWGEIICRALGNEPGLFSTIFEKNLNTHDEVILNSNMVASILREFIKGRSCWEGTPTELRNVLYDIAYSRGESRYFPTTPQSLTNHLNRLKDNLANVGITFDSRHSGNRTITVTNRNSVEDIKADPFKSF